MEIWEKYGKRHKADADYCADRGLECHPLDLCPLAGVLFCFHVGAVHVKQLLHGRSKRENALHHVSGLTVRIELQTNSLQWDFRNGKEGDQYHHSDCNETRYMSQGNNLGCNRAFDIIAEH